MGVGRSLNSTLRVPTPGWESHSNPLSLELQLPVELFKTIKKNSCDDRIFLCVRYTVLITFFWKLKSFCKLKSNMYSSIPVLQLGFAYVLDYLEGCPLFVYMTIQNMPHVLKPTPSRSCK